MTTTEPSTVADESPATHQSGTLGAFPGTFVPGLCFESGHCFWFLVFRDTPTRFDAYTELWIITPDGERVLYTDPEPAAEEVQKYHDFDQVNGATITYDISDNQVGVSMEGTDGTELELTAAAGQTVGTRILNTVIALTPDVILRSRMGTTVSTLSLNLLLDANGLKVAGRTETDRRYRLDAERIQQITDASGTLDGRDLGSLSSPTRPIEFGDAKATADALYVPGTLHLEQYTKET